jgi:hypothetical protein
MSLPICPRVCSFWAVAANRSKVEWLSLSCMPMVHGCPGKTNQGPRGQSLAMRVVASRWELCASICAWICGSILSAIRGIAVIKVDISARGAFDWSNASWLGTSPTACPKRASPAVDALTLSPSASRVAICRLKPSCNSASSTLPSCASSVWANERAPS